MFISIAHRGQWMDYRCGLVRKLIHCFGAQRPREKIDLSYSLGLWDFIFFCPIYCFPCSRISSYLPLFLCLNSFLLSPCASVWENTLLLLKKVSRARLGESDIHPISPKTPAPTIPTYRQKEEKGKESGRLQQGQSSLGQ